MEIPDCMVISDTCFLLAFSWSKQSMKLALEVFLAFVVFSFKNHIFF